MFSAVPLSYLLFFKHPPVFSSFSPLPPCHLGRALNHPLLSMSALSSKCPLFFFSSPRVFPEPFTGGCIYQIISAWREVIFLLPQIPSFCSSFPDSFLPPALLLNYSTFRSLWHHQKVLAFKTPLSFLHTSCYAAYSGKAIFFAHSS